jgi:hypothetical protein
MDNEKTCQLINPQIPLAVYREMAAHLQMVPAVKTEFIPQDSKTFDYGLSQIKGLAIAYSGEPRVEAELKPLLAYYVQQFRLVLTETAT